MSHVVVTKDVARLQTREQRLRRYQELLGKESYDEEVNDAKQAKVTGQLIDTKEKVKPDDFEFLKVIGRGSFGKVMQGLSLLPPSHVFFAPRLFALAWFSARVHTPLSPIAFVANTLQNKHQTNKKNSAKENLG